MDTVIDSISIKEAFKAITEVTIRIVEAFEGAIIAILVDCVN